MYHCVGQQAQIALLIADLGHCTDQQKARLVNVNMCAETQSHADSYMRLGGITTVSLDIRSKVEAFLVRR